MKQNLKGQLKEMKDRQYRLAEEMKNEKSEIKPRQEEWNEIVRRRTKERN